MRFYKILHCSRGQALVETVLALPVLIFFFMAALSIAQLTLAHILVKTAVYEAARYCYQREQGFQQATAIATKICKHISAGKTEFFYTPEQCKVSHQLHWLIPIIPNITIQHTCPAFLFFTGRESE